MFRNAGYRLFHVDPLTAERAPTIDPYLYPDVTPHQPPDIIAEFGFEFHMEKSHACNGRGMGNFRNLPGTTSCARR